MYAWRESTVTQPSPPSETEPVSLVIHQLLARLSDVILADEPGWETRSVISSKFLLYKLNH